MGGGIHDREGVTLGTPYTRTYTFVRDSRAPKHATYNLTWVGNDGTSQCSGTISLPKGSPQTLTVDVNPTEYGAHSAILNLDDPATPGIDYQTMNIVVVPYEFTAATRYSQKSRAASAQPDPELLPPGPCWHSRIQGGLPAARAPRLAAGQARFLRFHPYGVGIDSNTSTNCYVPDAGAGCIGGSPTSRTTTNPFAGVWEVTVEARRTSDADFTPYTMTASILGATSQHRILT